MAPSVTRAPRRTEALSRDKIVDAAVEVLGNSSEPALAVRTLTEHLATGRGAIYHHIASMDELVAAAADRLLQGVTSAAGETAHPAQDLRQLAVGLFDVIDASPWVGAQLSRHPSQPAVFRLWGSVGKGLQRLGLTGPRVSDAGAALVNYIVGALAQHSAGAGRATDLAARQAFLDELSDAWLDQNPHAAANDAAAHLSEHDDRQQFIAGVDIFLRGVLADRP